MSPYELIDRACESETITGKPLLASSRRSPVRSAVKRYCQWLGLDPAEATPAAYHKSAQEIAQVIETHAPKTLSPNTLRNLKSDVTALLSGYVQDTCKNWS
jgi:hypothetical protein